MSALTRPLIAGCLLVLAIGCEPTPCDDYVNYMCDCHDGDAGVDCQTLGNTYANADAQLEDECAIALEDQVDQDAIDGVECSTGTTTSASAGSTSGTSGTSATSSAG